MRTPTRPRAECSDYPQPVSSVVTGGGASLLEDTINERQVQVVVVLLECDGTPVAAYICVSTFVLVKYICVNQACSLFKQRQLPLHRK